MTTDDQKYMEACSIAAMQGLITGAWDDRENATIVAMAAWKFARAMLVERNRILSGSALPPTDEQTCGG